MIKKSCHQNNQKSLLSLISQLNQGVMIFTNEEADPAKEA
jgi:hypothetical protein